MPDPATVQNFAQGSSTPVDLEFDASGQLYYADIANGEIKRIFTTAGNLPPALAQADPQGGPVPLTVDFDATGSSDPNLGDTLTYKWDLDGDGQLDDSTVAQPSSPTTPPGCTVTLEVTDTGMASDTDTVTINASSGPPTASIDAPTSATTWRVGQAISFSGPHGPRGRSAARVSTDWSLILHHCSTPTDCHEHHIQDFLNTAGGSFAAPDHEYPSHLELRLTATDSNSSTDTKSLQLDPQTSTVTVHTSPAGTWWPVRRAAQARSNTRRSSGPATPSRLPLRRHSTTARTPSIPGPTASPRRTRLRRPRRTRRTRPPTRRSRRARRRSPSAPLPTRTSKRQPSTNFGAATSCAHRRGGQL